MKTPLRCLVFYGLIFASYLAENAWCFSLSRPSIDRSRLAQTSLHSTQASSADSTSLSNSSVTITLPSFLRSNTEEEVKSDLHAIHIESILGDDEASTVLNLARKHSEITGCWERPDSDRHLMYATVDFPVDESKELASYLQEIDFDGRMWTLLSKKYGIKEEYMSYEDLFCANYQANEAGSTETTMDRLEVHRDGSFLSFSVLLSAPSDFSGGGTLFDALRDTEPTELLHEGGIVRPRRAGDCVLHSGKVLHGADVVTSGQRTVLVGFVHVEEFCVSKGVLAEACKHWGRMDVAEKLWKVQQEATASGKRRLWHSRNDKWFPKKPGRSYLIGPIPFMKGVKRRGEPEWLRRKKLEAEDRLLRTAFLPENPDVLTESTDFTLL